MIKLLIEEEYGFRYWYAELSEAEFNELVSRWQTLRGVTCLVPVNLIVPQAKLFDEELGFPKFTHRCHLHENDDSHLDGCIYDIPWDIHFWMNGKRYEESEYWPNPKQEYWPSLPGELS